MKVQFCGLTAEACGLNLVADDIGIEVVSDSAEITVCVERVEENILSVSLNGKEAKIKYGGGMSRFYRGVATLFGWIRSGIAKKSIVESPIFTFNGPMLDMSRNMVLNVKTVKMFLRKTALMGMNAFMLYTEDTYEIENRPYFGYLRGRYTKEEIKEIDSYAASLGIELVPCIQVLGHLATHLRWVDAARYRDTENALLVGEEETYKLIDDMLRTVTECFTSKRIHIGMDETKDLGLGKYLDRNGYRERFDIYLEHLTRVAKMVEGYGLHPMMWSDMFFRMAGKELENYRDYDLRVELPENISELVPKGVQQVFWDYYSSDKNFYAANIEKHKKFGSETMFAGGVRSWDSHTPAFTHSLEDTLPALTACKEGGVKEVLLTVWANGSSSILPLSIASFAWFADFDYRGEFTEAGVKECFENACVGCKYEDFIATELVTTAKNPLSRTSPAAIYNDMLLGISDGLFKNVRDGYFSDAMERLDAISSVPCEFKSSFDAVKSLSSLLLNKADFSIRLKAAYSKNDKDALKLLADECTVISDKTRAFRKSFKKMWFECYKAFGWEAQDIMLGALIQRADTTKWRITEYLDGRVQQIDELMERSLDSASIFFKQSISGNII